MVSGILIVVVSVVLVLYWLRYSCVMLLRSTQERRGFAMTGDERFSVSSVQERLKTEADLGSLERSLERDYHIVAYLIEHTADLELAPVESRLLVLDYRLMRFWSRLTRTVAPQQSRQALGEMASVLSVLVSQVSEHTQIQMEA